jgi:glycosyltransferase involved in cell wall biosynthesis
VFLAFRTPQPLATMPSDPNTVRNSLQASSPLQGDGHPAPAVSVVVPVKNEAGNIAPLVAEIAAALQARRFEIVYVNDGSEDATEAELRGLMAQWPCLRQIRHDRSCGQSAAVRTGVTMARAPIVVTLDGDCQNDPAYIPEMIAKLEGAPRVGLVAAQRVGRKATISKKLQSRIANSVRRAVLKDGTRDTGCGMKAFRRDLFLSLPYFDGIHCFLPALVRREGFDIGYVDVVDRPRRFGTSNYGMWNRLWVGILDMAGVWWLIRRTAHIPRPEEVTPSSLITRAPPS